MCNTECHGCPFECSDYSEQIQNYGCLPTQYDILTMRYNHGKTWACHSDPTKPCTGAINRLKKLGLDYKVIDTTLQTEKTDWHLYIAESNDNYEVFREKF